MNPFDFIPPPSDVKHQVTVGSESITNNDDGADSDCLIRNGGAGQHSTFDHRPDQTTVSLQNTTLSTSLQLASSRTRGETGSEKEVGVLADSNEFFHHSAIGSTVDDDGGDDFRRAYDHENDDDEDSYHDLDAVMALVTASESNWNDDSRRIMSANSQLPPEPQSKRTTLSTTNEESKEEISDALRMSPSPLRHPPLPRYFASSAAVVAASEEAIVLETTTSPQVARRQQFNDDERLAESLKEEDDLLLAMKLSAYEGRGDTLGAIPTWQYGEVNQALHHQEATVVAIADHYYNVQFSSSADSRQRHNAAGTTATAEWIGQDFSSNPIVTSEAHASAQLCGQPLAEDEDLGNNGSDDGITREATVIDSAPLEKQDDVPLGYTEEARVLVDSQDADSSNDADLDRKPAALPRTSRHRNSSSRDGTDVGNLEAEVVAVQERGEVHPAEYTLEQTFQAEFVGTNSSFTVAVPSTSQTSSAVADTAAVIPNLRHTQITSTAVGPPQAIASISTSTENAMVTDSVADVVTENVINIIPDDSMIEEALVFVSDDGDVIASDRKPPPKESLNRQRDTRSSSRSSLPSIAEQDNELAFHQNNSLPVAPFRHDARVLSDAELSWFDGEHVSADEHEFHHRTQNGTLLDNNHWACEQESFAAHAVGISEANCTNESILPEHEISLAEPSFSAATVVHNDSAALMGSIAHADIVGIQQDEDIHPADLEGIFQQSASADFVGEACYPAEEILTDPACTLVGVSSVALPEAATISPIHNTFFDQTSSERKDNQTVPIVASAFLDPHQPFTSEANDNEEFSPDDIDSFESSSYSVRGTITNTTIQQPVDTQINIPRESTLRETSNTTVDSESNHTSSTQRSIASANIQMVSD